MKTWLALGKVFLWFLPLAAAAAAVAYYFMREPVLDVTATTVQRGAVEQTVTCVSAGTVMPQERASITAATFGIVQRLYVDEGDRVEAGAMIAELAHDDLDANVALAEANLRAGETRVQQAKQSIAVMREIAATRLRQARAQFDLAKMDYERTQALSEKKAVASSDVDRVQLSYRVAVESVAAAEAGLREIDVREQEIQIAEQGVAQLRAALDLARATREKAFIRAPFPGVIAKKFVEAGEAVTPGMPIVHLVNESERYVVAPFDEANAPLIRVGQRARLLLDAYPDAHFNGEVTYVSPAVSVNPDLSRSVDVKVRLSADADKFVPGMSVDVVLVVDRKDNVLYVPSEALVRDQYAYVVQGDRAVRREVTVGIGNWETREIIQGLAEGETVVTSVALKGLKDNARLRIVEELER